MGGGGAYRRIDAAFQQEERKGEERSPSAASPFNARPLHNQRRVQLQTPGRQHGCIPAALSAAAAQRVFAQSKSSLHICPIAGKVVSSNPGCDAKSMQSQSLESAPGCVCVCLCVVTSPGCDPAPQLVDCWKYGDCFMT